MDAISFQMITSGFPVNEIKEYTFSENNRINMKLTKTSAAAKIKSSAIFNNGDRYTEITNPYSTIKAMRRFNQTGGDGLLYAQQQSLTRERPFLK